MLLILKMSLLAQSATSCQIVQKMPTHAYSASGRIRSGISCLYGRFDAFHAVSWTLGDHTDTSILPHNKVYVSELNERLTLLEVFIGD